jgi:hypothetical protein
MAALNGARFQTTIETVPYRAAEWREMTTRYKGSTTEIRTFGPGGVQ